MINGQHFLDQPVRYKLMTYDSIWKIAGGQGDDYTTDCFVYYNCFKVIAIDLSKNQALNADPKMML